MENEKNEKDIELPNEWIMDEKDKKNVKFDNVKFLECYNNSKKQYANFVNKENQIKK